MTRGRRGGHKVRENFERKLKLQRTHSKQEAPLTKGPRIFSCLRGQNLVPAEYIKYLKHKRVLSIAAKQCDAEKVFCDTRTVNFTARVLNSVKRNHELLSDINLITANKDNKIGLLIRPFIIHLAREFLNQLKSRPCQITSVKPVTSGILSRKENTRFANKSEIEIIYQSLKVKHKTLNRPLDYTPPVITLE